MIAALPMYDRPETAATNDRFWALIREALGSGPKELTRSDDLWALWQSPELVLAQTCGYPFRARLHDKVKLVATPVYDLPQCSPGYYYSVIVAQPKFNGCQELDGTEFAYNEALSQSGWASAYSWARACGISFGKKQATGSHRASVQAVAEGRADWAAVDAVSWAMMRRYDRFTDDLQILGRGPTTPALPFITAMSQDVDQLRGAIVQAIAALSQTERETLLLQGLTEVDADTYLAVSNPPSPD